MVSLSEFTYSLPPDRIAQYPLEYRDQSRLLVYQNSEISHSQFYNLPELIPADSVLVFNNTQVIAARIYFQKDTGAEIEIFLLSPEGMTPQQAMGSIEKCIWKCTIGNLKKWTPDVTLSKTLDGTHLNAKLIDRDEGIVQFSWDAPAVFAEIIRAAGVTPLPPYLKRKAENADIIRYQTIYSSKPGAVAAPTAGLHFTNKVLSSLKSKGIITDFLTLHVSAGTFQPIKTENAAEHLMHREQVCISRQNLETQLLDKIIISVGTTSLRTMESMYWYGVKLELDPNAPFIISQDDALQLPLYIDKRKAIQNVLKLMDQLQTDTLEGETALYIMPGYQFRMCHALITNFHQPASTLLLLIAAFIGPDWKNVYSEALRHDYRFLSFGDSSILWKS